MNENGTCEEPEIAMRMPYLAAWLIIMGMLPGCILPEKFTAEATIHKDTSYSLSYKGTMVDVSFLRQLNAVRKKGRGEASTASLNRWAADETAWAAEMRAELLNDGTFKNVQYAGNAVFNIEYVATGALTAPYHFFDSQFPILSFVPEENGVIIVRSGVKEGGWAELEETGVKIQGVFSLKTDAEVLEHNAGKTPGLFSKAYVWEIGPDKPVPNMALKIKD
jgi:hypothetical protein